MSNEPDHDGGHSDAALVRRVYSLEFARYIMLLALMVSIAGSIWFLMRSVDVGELVGGDISPQAVDRLEVARRVAVTSIACALATVPFWAAVVCRSANDIGVDVQGGRRSTALFAGAAPVAFGVGFLDRELGGSAGLLGTVLCLAAALWSLTVVKSVRSAMGRPASATSLLSIMLVLVVVLSWLGGLHDEVTSTNSVEALTFVGGLQVALLAVVTIVAAVGSGDVVKSVMLTRTTTLEPQRGFVQEPE